MPSSPVFDYASVPLERPWSQMRLLSFPPQQESPGPLQCNLEAFDLDDAPMFAALSYPWGDQSNRFEICCHGEQHLNITQSLHGALVRFACDQWSEEFKDSSVWAKLTDYTKDCTIRWLWADAICINQDDSKEKNSQVRLMKTIYQQAAYTFIWLGPETKGSNYILDLTVRLTQAKERCYAAHESRRFFEMGMRDCFVKYGIPQLSGQFTRYSSFLKQGWFTRAWIVQELAVSREPLLMFDRQMVT